MMLLTVLLVSAQGAPVAVAKPSAMAHPNILLIVADDMGAGDTPWSAEGQHHKLRMPNLAALRAGEVPGTTEHRDSRNGAVHGDTATLSAHQHPS